MNKPYKLLVCGGRDFKDKDLLFKTLDKICYDREWRTEVDNDGNWLPLVVLICGMAKGADTLAYDWAVVNWLTIEEYPAEWDKYGKSAGYVRNTKMLEEGDPDLVVAFPGGKGTQMMCDIARRAGVEVIEV